MKRALMLLIAPVFLAGCFGGTAMKESYYNLSAVPGGAAPAPSGTGPSIHVAAALVPEAVDRNAMVIRTGPNRVEIDDSSLWVEPLKAAIPRVLAEDLRRELGTDRVTSGRSGPYAPDFAVTVDVQRFESSLDAGATLEAAWTVAPTGSKAAEARKSGRTVITEPLPSRDAAGIAAAHSRALARMAAEIAAAIRR
jgi:uncharacterized lipoprotein YmbA